MTPAEAYIKDIIYQNGAISFRDFMHHALYAPQVGYYTRELTKIGRAGDFYTSPSLHKSFAIVIAQQTQEAWEIMDRPKRFIFLEFGAGMGHHALDFLEYLEGKPLFDPIEYWIIEINPSLVLRQQQILSKYISKVKWFQQLSQIEPFCGFIFCNEILDAFAVSLIEIKEGVPYEIWVDCKDGVFKEILMPCSKEIDSYISDFCPHLIDKTNKINDYRTEVNLEIKDWLNSIVDKLIEGFLVIIDYGYSAVNYYAPERNRGTLLCYYQHQVDEDPYKNIGEKDITAHVNFSSLVKWGNALTLKPCGFTTQGSYIISMGIDKIILELLGNNPNPFELAKIKGLFMPEGFGDTHKVLIQYKGDKEFKLRGFAMRNSINNISATE